MKCDVRFSESLCQTLVWNVKITVEAFLALEAERVQMCRENTEARTARLVWVNDMKLPNISLIYSRSGQYESQYF